MFIFKKNSFTLIELLIVIFILGILATLISSNFFTSLKKGRDARRKGDLEQIQRALEMYYEDKKTYPTFDIFAINENSLCETKIADDCGTEKVYMQKIPNDPQPGRSYKYEVDSSGKSYRLYACLENTQQVLPYSSPLTPDGGFSCSTDCFANDRQTKIKCIWGVSSPNVNP